MTPGPRGLSTTLLWTEPAVRCLAAGVGHAACCCLIFTIGVGSFYCGGAVG